MAPPKYSLPEIERRWLVSPRHLATLANQPHRIIEDTYLEGTLLRLRSMQAPDGAMVYKLCKKYGRHGAASNPITNIYLSKDEYLALSALAGVRVRKRRYAVADGAIDVYPSSPALAIFEVEFETEQKAADYLPPRFASEEITDDDAYSGAALAWRLARPAPASG